MFNVSQMIADDQLIYKAIIENAAYAVRCCIPCIVQSYNRVNNTVEAQPAIRERVVREDGSVQYVNLPLLINVPVVFPSSSSYGITFPLNRNDECLVLFSDLSIDNFWEKGSVQNPVEIRRHDLSDGIAIPCNLSLKKIQNIPNEFVMRSGNRTITFNELYSAIHSHTHEIEIQGTKYNTSGPR